jgi:hypothetical protein
MSGKTETRKRALSRREFVKGAAALVAGALAACAPKEISPTEVAPRPSDTPAPPTATAVPPTNTPLPPTATLVPPTATPVSPTATLTPQATATPTLKPGRTDLMAIYPKSKSRVAIVRHGAANSLTGEEQAKLLGKMLDSGIVELTGLQDAAQAWSTLFDARERVAIKVNCISQISTTVAVAMAVGNRLHEAAGIPLENIIIFDRTEAELKRAGYTITPNGPGIRCQATTDYAEPAKLSTATVSFSNVLLSCDALVNIPIPKDHDICGVTLAMKNHFGTIGNPWDLHANRCDPSIHELNAAAPIRTRARLIIGDALRVCPSDWAKGVTENALLFAFDPVAHDMLGRSLLIAKRAEEGKKPDYLQALSGYIASAAEAGLGTDKSENIDLKEIELS